MEADEQINEWRAQPFSEKIATYFTLAEAVREMLAVEFGQTLRDTPYEKISDALIVQLSKLPLTHRQKIARKAVKARSVPLAMWALPLALETVAPEERVRATKHTFEARKGGLAWLYEAVPAEIAVHPEISRFGAGEMVAKKAAEVLQAKADPVALNTLLKARRQVINDDRGKSEYYAQLVLRAALKTDEGSILWPDEEEDIRAALILAAIVQGLKLSANHPSRQDGSSLVQLFLTLHDAHFSHGDIAACNLADRLEDEVVRRAEQSEDPISLGVVLSPCVVFRPLMHCEARPCAKLRINQGRPVEEHVEALCPRLSHKRAELRGRGLSNNHAGAGRVQRDRRNPGYISASCSCAHVYPLSDVWTLVEAMSAVNHPPPEGLAPTDCYATWLAGYINRLNEIRSSLKCRVCEERFLLRRDYARYPARYRATVGSCRAKHEGEVYLSHCWNCGELIDSRDSRVSANPRGRGVPYVCFNCGAGPEKDRDFIGSICPVFGCGLQMQAEKDGVHFVCSNGHRIDYTPSKGERMDGRDMIEGSWQCLGKDPAFPDHLRGGNHPSLRTKE